MISKVYFSHSSRWKVVSGLKCTMCLNTEQSPWEPSLTHFPPGLTPAKKVKCARHWLSYHPWKLSSKERPSEDRTILPFGLWMLSHVTRSNGGHL